MPRLLGVEHVKALLTCQFVHASAGGEVIRILGAAMQHHDQRQGAAVGLCRDEELEVAL